MNAFQQAIAALMADPNVGRSAVYQAASGGTQNVRVTLLSPDRVIDMGMVGSIMPVAVARVAIADVPERPEADDVLTISGEVYVVTAARQDGQGLSWLVDLRDAPEQSGRSAFVRHSAA